MAAKKKTSKAEQAEGIDADAINAAKVFPEPEATYTEADAQEHLKDPNIIFIGRRTINGEVKDMEPPAYVIDGRDRFDLPHAEMQRSGFYNKEASRIIRAFPNLYKSFTKLGAR